jgi:hypothetical protein
MNNFSVWNITPCCPLKVNRRFRETSAPSSGSKPSKKTAPPLFTLVSCSDSSSNLKIETIYFSETSVEFERFTLRYSLYQTIKLFEPPLWEPYTLNFKCC